jgi:hypothetical protein
VDFTRNQNGFEQMIDRDFRTRFFGQLQRLLQDMQFKIIACAIRKQEQGSAELFFNSAALNLGE